MIYTGTSGFSYDDWKGEFYPAKIAKKDMLAHYARSFNAVEINSTYYAIPGAASFASMDAKTPADFRFVVKAHKDMTHADTANPASFDAFLGAIGPLIDSGKLGCVLAQYPWGFKPSEVNIDRLRDLRDTMGDIRTVVEFRNSDWVNDQTFELLRALDLGFCCVDEPHLKGLMPGVAVVTSDTGYIRFHGRNAKSWWDHQESYQRYDYLYSEEELQEWVPKAEEVIERARDTYMFFNNHYKGKSAVNARMFARMLGLPLPPETISNAKQMTLGDDF